MDFPGVPPENQVEFQIDLVPSAASIAKAPYWFETLQMQDLSSKL